MSKHTAFPFLMLFLRKASVATWAVLVTMSAYLLLVSLPLGDLPRTVRDLRGGISRLERTVNSYEFSNTSSSEIIGVGHLMYRLGLRDRDRIAVIQTAVLLLLGLLLFWRLVLRSLRDPGIAPSLLALYAMLFFYHRIYDSMILAIPLLHSADRIRRVQGAVRSAYICCGLACLAALYTPVGLLRTLTPRSTTWGPAGWLLQATVLAYADWAIIVALGCISFVAIRDHQCDAVQTVADQS